MEMNCPRGKEEETCKTLNGHRCIMFAKPVSEEGEQTRDEAPRLVRSSLVLIICKAKVLHKSDEEELIRFIEKLSYTHGIENFIYYTEKFRVIFYHVLLTAGIAGGIVFATLLLHNVTIFMHDEIPPSVEDWALPLIAGLLTFGIESGIFWREHLN